MKKIIILMLFLLAGQLCFACENVVCPTDYELTSGFSRFFSNATGQNFLAEKIGESLTKKVIKENVNSGKIKVKLDSYSVRDLKEGRFKSLKISGEDIVTEGVYINSFDANTLCEYNYISHDKNDNFYVMHDIPVAFKIKVSEENINETMKSTGYKKLIDEINSIGANFNIFKIDSTYVKLKNGKMFYGLKYSMPFMRIAKEVVLASDLEVNNGRIMFANTNFVNSNTSMDIRTFSKILNYVNPLAFSAKILENKEAKFNIETVKISDKIINIEGKMIILKDKD